jgi:hypothetical protein
MIQAISKAERLNMLPEDYFLRKQFLLKDIKEELSLVISLVRNNPYSSDLKEYVKMIQGEINELGFFCILPNPDSVNAERVYQQTLVHMQFLTDRDCRSLAADQYTNIDLGKAICLHYNKVRDLLLQFLPNEEEVNKEFAKYEKYLAIFKKARLTSMTTDEAEILNRYFVKYKSKIMELKERVTL